MTRKSTVIGRPIKDTNVVMPIVVIKRTILSSSVSSIFNRLASLLLSADLYTNYNVLLLSNYQL